MVVVCKSCSVPVHVSGQYRRNTVLQILDKLHGLSDLLNVNRLDRVSTSTPMLASSGCDPLLSADSNLWTLHHHDRCHRLVSVVAILVAISSSTTHHRHQLKRPLSVVVVQVTSGVVILARSKPVARRLTEQIQSDSVRKEYLARVVGTFPAGPILCEA